MKTAKWLIVGAACLSATTLTAQQPASTAAAQTPATSGAATAPLNAAIPFDSQITTGRFANGLRYYIRKNKKPEKRAELRLVVNAGSILEERDQSRARAFRRAHGVQRHEALPEAGDGEVPRIDRHAFRARA